MDGTDDIYSAGDGTALRFFYEPVKNNFQSEKAGAPIFDTSLFVEVITPGSTESMPKFEVERTYCEQAGLVNDARMVERSPKYEQYKQQVEAYKDKSGEFLTSGTPLTQWPVIDAGTAATLQARGIKTVEMLAGVSDGNLANLGTGGRVLRDQAKGYIDSRQFAVPSAQMSATNANLMEENARLTSQVTDLNNRLSTVIEENTALRNGSPVPMQEPGATDPLSPVTISAPNPFASLDAGTASPLTPNDAGEADKGALAAGNALTPAGAPPAPII